MALEIRAFIAANDSRLKSKEIIMLLTPLCLLLNIDGLVENSAYGRLDQKCIKADDQVRVHALALGLASKL
jgi:hypothetical protein